MATEFVPPRQYRTDRRSPLRWLWSHTRRHIWLLVLMFLGALGNGLAMGLIPMWTGRAFDALVTRPPQWDGVLKAAAMVAGLYVLRAGLMLMRNFSAETIAQRMERDVRDEFYTALLGKSMAFHDRIPVGEIMARATNDVREINLMFAPGVNLVVGSLMFLIMPLVMAPRYAPDLLLVPTLFLVLYFVLLVAYLRALSPLSMQVRETFGRLSTHVNEVLDGVETVKALGQEDYEIQRVERRARAYRDAVIQQGYEEAKFWPFLLFGVTLAAGAFHALYLAWQGVLTVGDVVAYVGLLNLLRFPTFVSQFAYAQVALGFASAKRLLELLNFETPLDHNPQGYDGLMRGEVEFRDVWFGYDPEKPVLKGISFKVKAGTRVAIVGPTGSGKSTLVKLINRTYDVTRGSVRVDGMDVRDWNLAALRSQIAIIEQDIFLFSRSIRENIAFGRPEASQEDVETAARWAQAHDFITHFPEGYDTKVGERGVALSGGQRQRIALARAFLTDPRILILDDATSAIDSATEDEIQKAIFRVAEGRTTFIITHRLSQIRWADWILVLDQGRLVAQGTHEELMRTCEVYRRLFQIPVADMAALHTPSGNGGNGHLRRES